MYADVRIALPPLLTCFAPSPIRAFEHRILGFELNQTPLQRADAILLPAERIRAVECVVVFTHDFQRFKVALHLLLSKIIVDDDWAWLKVNLQQLPGNANLTLHFPDLLRA